MKEGECKEGKGDWLRRCSFSERSDTMPGRYSAQMIVITTNMAQSAVPRLSRWSGGTITATRCIHTYIPSKQSVLIGLLLRLLSGVTSSFHPPQPESVPITLRHKVVYNILTSPLPVIENECLLFVEININRVFVLGRRICVQDFYRSIFLDNCVIKPQHVQIIIIYSFSNIQAPASLAWTSELEKLHTIRGQVQCRSL